MRTNYLIVLFLSLFFASCNSNRWEINDEYEEKEIDFKRFDLELYEESKSQANLQSIASLKESNPRLFPLYSKAIMRFDNISENGPDETFIQFLSDSNIIGLLNDVAIAFPNGNLDTELEQLSNGLNRFHYYFPRNQFPKVRTMISAFTYSTATDDSLLLIGLDNYLGSDYYLYPKIGVPKYLFQNFKRDYIVSDALKAWITSEFEGQRSTNLIDQMIFSGRVLYVLKALLPDAPNYLLFNYNESELEWCLENEKEIWAHFIDMDLLFTDKNFEIRKYMGDAPFIPGFPEGSPGRVGQWVGYQIVNEYMEKNNEITLEELMNLDNSNKILQESKYKPRL